MGLLLSYNSLTVIRPVVTYGSETWVLKEAMKQKLLIYERKILRRIFGRSKNMDGSWRIKTNEELNKLIKYKNIVNHIKAQRLGWFGHVYRMENDRLVKRIYIRISLYLYECVEDRRIDGKMMLWQT
jgi:hypothetical protein